MSANPLSGNPNAAVGGISTVGGGEAIVNIAKLFGWSISTGWGIAIAGGIAYVVLFIGRNGITGAWNVMLRGNSKTAPPAPPVSPPTG